MLPSLKLTASPSRNERSPPTINIQGLHLFSGVYIQSPSLSLRNLLSQTQRRSRLNFLPGSVFIKKHVSLHHWKSSQQKPPMNSFWANGSNYKIPKPDFFSAHFEVKFLPEIPKQPPPILEGHFLTPRKCEGSRIQGWNLPPINSAKTPHELSLKTPLSPRMVYQDLVQDAKNLGLFFCGGSEEGHDACQNPHSEIWWDEAWPNFNVSPT